MELELGQGNVDTVSPLPERDFRGQLAFEAKLVSQLVTDCLSVLHQTAPEVSLVGEFVGLVSVTGGVGTAIIAMAETKHVTELAKFFADRFDSAAEVFRRIEAGEDVATVLGGSRNV